MAPYEKDGVIVGDFEAYVCPNCGRIGFSSKYILGDRIILYDPQRFFINPALNIVSVTPFG